VVEVAHNNDETLVLLSQQVLDGHLDVLKLHECSCSGSRVRGLDLLGLDTLAARDQKDGEALLRLAACHKIVGEHAVGDPFPGEGQGQHGSIKPDSKTYFVPLTM